MAALVACGGSSSSTNRVDGRPTVDAPLLVDARQPIENGGACQTSTECASGHCVDGVCCDTACDSTCSACAATDTGQPDGTCAPVLQGTDPANECAESACGTAACDGAGACGAKPSTSMCRDAVGECDQAEVCDGVALECPADARKPQNTTCRDLAGTCDVLEVCDGTSVDCPTNEVLPDTTACSADYECDGTNGTCPTFCSTDFDCAGDSRACINNQCVPGVRVFVSSTTTNGNIGGLVGADAFCQSAATAASLKGTYKAWLSDSTTSPYYRFSWSPVPYYQMNGVKVADSFADIIDGTFNRIPYVLETGIVPPQSVPFTGTSFTGVAMDPATPLQSNCNGWTSNSATHYAWCGVSGEYAGEPAWTQSSNSGSPRACNVVHRLYCFAQPIIINN